MLYFSSHDLSRSLTQVFLVFSLFVFTACRPSPNSEPEQSAEQQSSGQFVLPQSSEQPFDTGKPEINLARPLERSTLPEDVALCEKINQTIEESPFANARWGVVAVSLKDGRVVCGRDERKLFNPASIQKILTSIVALDLIDTNYRWKTSVYARGQIEPDGTLNGDLILYGQGAPDFAAAGLEKLVADLQAKGLKRVTGNIVGDDSYFRGSAIGDGWTWNELQWYYGAEASALTFNDNQAFITVENGAPRPQTDYLQVSGGSEPPSEENEAKKVNSAGITRGLESNDFYVWGEKKDWGARVAVHKPAGWAAKAFKDSLSKRGIEIAGDARSVDWTSPEKLDPAQATELVFLESQTLGEVVHKMNKQSNNLYAELLLRTIGKLHGASAPDERMNFQEVRGDDHAGASVIKKWLRERNVATDEIEIHDGSGLSRLDFVTPEAFARALIYAAQMRQAEAFKNSLPVSATDGTLGGRLGKVKGKVLAKTGTVTFVSSLAGYAQRSEGETFAFAIICNNQTRKANSAITIDQIVTLLADNEKADSDAANTNTNANSASPSPEKSR